MEVEEGESVLLEDRRADSREGCFVAEWEGDACTRWNERKEEEVASCDRVVEGSGKEVDAWDQRVWQNKWCFLRPLVEKDHPSLQCSHGDETVDLQPSKSEN